MNKEDYVSFEVAKLLKEKGFNEPYLYFYRNGSLYTLSGDIIYCENDNVNNRIIYPQPTLYEAQKWLRNKYEIHINVNKYVVITQIDADDKIRAKRDFWAFSIYYTTTFHHIHDCLGQYSSYEEALNEGIKETLKLI